MRGDNVGVPTLLVKMRPANPKQAIIVRELALRLVKLSFLPDAAHTPGVAHVVADRLSRIFAPGGSDRVDNSIHPALKYATPTTAPSRDKEWYRALE